MSPIWIALWFLVAVSLLVTVHEFGHFWVARRLGFKVLRFSVGFGKPLISRTFGPDRTEYVLAAIPLGGYVRMLDEREAPVAPEELSRSFTRRPPWQRILVLLAGPGCNILFAILVLWGMYWVSGLTEYKPVVGEVRAGSVAARAGLRPGDEIRAVNTVPVGDQSDVVFNLLDAISARGEAALAVSGTDGLARTTTLSIPDPAQRKRLTEPTELFRGLGFDFWLPPAPAVLRQVNDGPAARAGLKPGDRIVAIGGVPIKDFKEVSEHVSSHPGETLAVTYRRNGLERTVPVHVSSELADGKRVGRLGVEVGPELGGSISYPPSMVRHTTLSPLAALSHASNKAWDMTELQARLLWRMVLGQVSLKNLNGPISIAEYAGESAEGGVASFLGFLVLISLQLGFLNLLPIPILDGGQIAFQLIEWLKGSPLSERAQIFGQQVGIALLLLLMGVALFNDIAHQFQTSLH